MKTQQYQRRKATCCALSLLLVASCAEGRLRGTPTFNNVEDVSSQPISRFLRLLQETFGDATPVSAAEPAANGFGSATAVEPEEEDEGLTTRLGPLHDLEQVTEVQATSNSNSEFGNVAAVEDNSNAVRAQAAPAMGAGLLGDATPIEAETNSQEPAFGDVAPAGTGGNANPTSTRAQAAPANGGFGQDTAIEAPQGVDPMSVGETEFGDVAPHEDNPGIRAQQAPAMGGGFGQETAIEAEPVDPSATQFGDVAPVATESLPEGASTRMQAGLGNDNGFGDQQAVASSESAGSEEGSELGTQQVARGSGRQGDVALQGADSSNTNGLGSQVAVPSGNANPQRGGYLNSANGFGSSTPFGPGDSIHLTPAAQNGPLGELEAQAQQAPAQASAFGAQEEVLEISGSGTAHGSSLGSQQVAGSGPSDVTRHGSVGLQGAGSSNPTNGFGTQETVQASSPQGGSSYLNSQDSTFGSAEAAEEAGTTTRVQQAPAAGAPHGFGTQQTVPTTNSASATPEFGTVAAPTNPAAPTNTRGNSGGFAGTVTRPGSETAFEAMGDVRTQQCTMKIKFFRGHEKEPTPVDVNGLMQITNKYFTHLYSANADTKAAFNKFQASEIKHSYGPSFGEDSDFFYCEFTSNIDLMPGSRVGMSEIHKVINEADFDDFIKNYIWKSPPAGENQFYETSSCKLKCEDSTGR